MSREDPKINIRLPADLKDQLHAMAADNKRSVNSEVVAAIEHAVHLHNLAKSRDEKLKERDANGNPRYMSIEEAEKQLLQEVISVIYKRARNNS